MRVLSLCFPSAKIRAEQQELSCSVRAGHISDGNTSTYSRQAPLSAPPPLWVPEGSAISLLLMGLAFGFGISGEACGNSQAAPCHQNPPSCPSMRPCPFWDLPSTDLYPALGETMGGYWVRTLLPPPLDSVGPTSCWHSKE